MSPSTSVELADAVSETLYALAGWLLVGLGGLGVVVPALAFARGAGSNPAIPAVIALLSLCLVAGGVFVNPRVRRRRSVAQFGRSRVVEHRVLRAEEDRTERCVVCDTRTATGELRRYRTEFCLAGVAVHSATEGENAYCPDCATADSPDEKGAPADEQARAEPLTESEG